MHPEQSVGALDSYCKYQSSNPEIIETDEIEERILTVRGTLAVVSTSLARSHLITAYGVAIIIGADSTSGDTVASIVKRSGPHV